MYIFHSLFSLNSYGFEHQSVFIAKIKAILKIDKPFYNALELHIHSIMSIYITTI